MEFKLSSQFKPDGDQPQAIRALADGLRRGFAKQTLLGVTGSGKTFTAAKVIAEIGKPGLVIAHNKTLAAQLAQEYRDFFPDNAVHYFVSYYDYYQPEAYLPITDTYIEKDAKINQEIERLRHGATQALLTRRDVIVVASVSCIYGLGSPEEYLASNLRLVVGEEFERLGLLKAFVGIYFERTNADLKPGTFRTHGSVIEIMPASENEIIEITLAGKHIAGIRRIDAITRSVIRVEDSIFIFPAKHFVMPEDMKKRAFDSIREELAGRLAELEKEDKVLEAERLRRRTTYDLAMMKETGYCSGIENYSRHFSGRKVGETPDTLISYFPKKTDGSADFVVVVDESHVTIPQIAGMYAGDRSRKQTLVQHGFRLPSALDNRPLRFEEFERLVGQMIFTSATPGDYEYDESKQIVEQIIRPTGLVDPLLDIRPIVERDGHAGQIADMIQEVEKVTARKARTLVTVLTKKMAEDLSSYLKERGVKAEYLHSEIKTIERIKILSAFRRGEFDCLVGVNLLREGLDLPEVELVAILDADKEGFLRSQTALIQTIGRAARNVAGRVILYADQITGSIKAAVDETNRRRERQLAYNAKHGVTPASIKKNISDITDLIQTEHEKAGHLLAGIDIASIADKPKELKKLIKDKEDQMSDVVKALDFETAAVLRDELKELRTLISA
ncbi:MAG: excinuclease ABC subunit UvrB [Candidatus Vogelbacteria bacterium]|nr:excinuclease ABC subunit UvrB [Candidatus Vogelbacteria bacterium]